MMANQDEYVPIPLLEYCSNYSISNTGDIFSVKRKIVLKPCIRNGYFSVCLSYNNTKKNYLVHRLVAITFIENPNRYDIVNHKDGNKFNNNVSNLEWTTYSSNARHSIEQLNNKRSTVPILQLTLDGIIINKFDSIKDAEIRTGVSSKHIPSVCTGLRKSAGGFLWKYVNDERVEAPEGKTLIDYPGYIITKDGAIYSSKSQKYLSLKQHSSGYISVSLSNKVKKDFYVHVLVATLYLPMIPGKSVVNHIDRDKSNNKLVNLEWVTDSENTVHAVETGVNSYTKGVIQYDNNCKELNTYSSVREASCNSGVDSSSIVRVCKGRQKTAGNYFWKYL